MTEEKNSHIDLSPPTGREGVGRPNRLIHESSPYLLQHAHNPVDWYPWSEEAFERAVAEDKPVLVSIGYAACHWCHVMERESFEKEEVAAIMNEHFINIKVDREERPDVDHIYMDAVQAISGSGGWPLNVFLLPDKKPFYGGTYFPPVRAFNRAAWPDVLLSVATAYRERKPELEAQAENLTRHLEVSNSFSAAGKDPADAFNTGNIDTAFTAIMKTADRQWGGFGKAPKFPQTFTIGFLLRYAHLTGNSEARQQALLSLDKMMEGGIYDHIGGGFARYSTDTEWLAPHFEKMLYDNALIVVTLADAYALTGDAGYRKVLEETLAFTERELGHGEGGFFSALDADSEGVEGKFYVWQKSEIEELLGEEAALFCEYYDVTEGGNWEHTNILRTLKPLPLFAKEKGLDEVFLKKRFESGKMELLHAREGRIRPGLDDKIILGWNALMNTAFSRAYAVTGQKHYLEVARKNMHFLLTRFSADNDQFYHTWKDGKAKYPAFLDDYSNLIAALITLAQAAADYSYLDKAALLTGVVTEMFIDADSPHFFYTGKDQKDILLRKKELFDGATPSGNAVMAQNLYNLSILLDNSEWRQKSENAVKSMAEAAIRYPTSFGIWLTALHQIINGAPEITIAGPAWQDRLREVQALFLPYGIIMAAEKSNAAYPLLKDKDTGDETLIFLCHNYACRQPVKRPGELRELLKAV